MMVKARPLQLGLGPHKENTKRPQYTHVKHVIGSKKGKN